MRRNRPRRRADRHLPIRTA